MRVPGEQQIVAVGHELVDDPWFRRVQDGEPKVGASVSGPGDLIVTIAVDVRVVYAGHLDIEVASGL